MTQRQGAQLAKIIRSQIGEPSIGCEVGVWEGMTSAPLLRLFPNLHLLMVDRYQAYDPGGRGPVSQKAKKPASVEAAMTTAMKGTSFAADRRIMIVADSVDAANMIRNEFLDFVYIDAGHDPESVRKDLDCWYGKVRWGGVFSGHDYRGTFHEKHGVREAVDEFVKRLGRKVRVGREENWWIKK